MKVVILITCFIFGFLVLDQALVRANNNNGIYPIGKNAVYLEGEACTVNMPLSMGSQDLIPLFNKCLELHNKARHNKQ